MNMNILRHSASQVAHYSRGHTESVQPAGYEVTGTGGDHTSSGLAGTVRFIGVSGIDR
jgi:hypothetical protein